METAGRAGDRCAVRLGGDPADPRPDDDAFGFVGAPWRNRGFARGPAGRSAQDLTQGVLGGDLDWGLIGVGALIGAGVIVIDEVLTRTSRFRLPPLAVGMGMYPPMVVTLIIPVGAFLGSYYNKWARTLRRRRGTQEADGYPAGDRPDRR